MRFKCGSTELERQRRIDYLEDWHLWFAWYPVDVSTIQSDCRWLEKVHRRLEWKKDDMGDWRWHHYYRRLK